MFVTTTAITPVYSATMDSRHSVPIKLVTEASTISSVNVLSGNAGAAALVLVVTAVALSITM